MADAWGLGLRRPTSPSSLTHSLSFSHHSLISPSQPPPLSPQPILHLPPQTLRSELLYNPLAMASTAAALRSGFHRAVAGMISPGVHRSDAMMPPPYPNPEPPLDEIDSVAFNMEFNLSLASPPRDHIFWESKGADAWYLPLDTGMRPDIFQDEARVAESSIVTSLAHQRQVVQVSDWLDRIQLEGHGRLRCLFLVSRPRRPFNGLGSDKTPSLAVSFMGPRDMVRQCRMMTMNNFPIMVRPDLAPPGPLHADVCRPRVPSQRAWPT